MADETEALAFLARSGTRPDALRRLAEVGPCSLSGLATDLDASRRTVKRAVSVFVTRGWVAETPDGYDLTALGEEVLETYEAAVESVAVASALGPILERLRADACDIPVTAFEGAEVVEATESDPNAPVERILQFRREANYLRELSSIFTRESASQLHRQALEDDIEDAELVLERDLAETIGVHPKYGDHLQDVVRADGITILVHDGSFPFFLALDERQVALGVTTEEGFPALVVAESAIAYDWAWTVYDRFRTESKPLTERQMLARSTDPDESDME